MSGATLEAAQAAKAKLAAILAGRSELRGIGIAVLDCGYGVKINLSSQLDDLTVPNDIDGVPVIVDVVGRIRAL